MAAAAKPSRPVRTRDGGDGGDGQLQRQSPQLLAVAQVSLVAAAGERGEGEGQVGGGDEMR